MSHRIRVALRLAVVVPVLLAVAPTSARAADLVFEGGYVEAFDFAGGSCAPTSSSRSALRELR